MGPFMLIRHAQPLRDTSCYPAEWDLGPDSVGAILGLADALRDRGRQRLVTSAERKDVQTGRVFADLLDLATSSDPRLNEVHRPSTGDDGAFGEKVRAYLAGDAVSGWEHHQTVIDRMQGAVEDAASLAPAALVSHGTAMALYLDHLGLVRALEFWPDLTSPDAWVVDGTTLRRLGPTL
jgi:broad specificity phosphatase PhoE